MIIKNIKFVPILLVLTFILSACDTNTTDGVSTTESINATEDCVNGLTLNPGQACMRASAGNAYTFSVASNGTATFSGEIGGAPSQTITSTSNTLDAFDGSFQATRSANTWTIVDF